MPVRSTLMSTSLMPILGTSTSPSQRPGALLLFTSACIRSIDSMRRSGRDVIRREGRAFAKEVLVHLLDEELLGFLVAEVEAVLVHDHLQAVYPHLPGFLGNVVVDLLPQRMAVEGHFIEAFHFLLKLHTEYPVGSE